MILEVTHPKEPTEEDPIDNIDFMDPHNIAGVLPDLTGLGGAKIRLPVLIEEKTIPEGTTTTTFNNLNGDQDEEYLIIGSLTVIANSVDREVILKPNNVSATTTSSIFNNDSATSTSAVHSNKFSLTSAIFSQNTFSSFEALIIAKTGKPRIYMCNNYLISTSHRSNQIRKGYWSNTVDNITSIVLDMNPAGGSFHGTLKLYKIIDIPIVDLANP